MCIYICVCVCCILTLDRTRCFSCAKILIAGCTCVKRKAAKRRCKMLTWVESEIRWRYEIIYTQVPQSNGQSQSCFQKRFSQVGRAAVGRHVESAIHSNNCQQSSVFSQQCWRLESQSSCKGPSGPLVKTGWEYFVKEQKLYGPESEYRITTWVKERSI